MLNAQQNIQHITHGQMVPTMNDEDAHLVPLSFAFAATDFQLILSTSYTLACRIMLCGLFQVLYACGVSLSVPSLPELYEEERTCAMLICMTMDYAASLAPYGSVCFLLPLQVAWGAYWRQNDCDLIIDPRAIRDWLVRRGDGFLSFCTTHRMSEAGLIFFTKRLMGGPLLQQDSNVTASSRREIAELMGTPSRIKEGRDLADMPLGVESNEIPFEQALRGLSDSSER